MSEFRRDVSTRRDLLRLFARNARERAHEVAPIIREARQAAQAIDLGGGGHLPIAIENEGRSARP
jgi:hypothetical protein